MKPKTNRMLMLLVSVAVAGCSTQTERSSSGGDQTAIEYEKVGGSSNAVTKEELERRAAAKAEAEKAQTAPPPAEPPKAQAAAVQEAPPPPKPAPKPAVQEEATPDFPVTTYSLPEEQAQNDEETEELGEQEDESVSEAQEPSEEAESSVGETTEYADDDSSDSDEIEELGEQEDESVSEAQEPAQEAESSVGETTAYDDDSDEKSESAEVEDLGPVADESGTASYPEDSRGASEKIVGDPTIYPDEKTAQAEPAPPPKPKPAAPKVVSVNFETEPLFSFDKSQVRADQRAKLDEFVSSLSGTQYTSVSVVGHADRIGKNAYNQKLSERRAEAVKAYLVSKGIAKDKIQSEGRGSSEPTTANACDKLRGKALISCLQPDRRVEVSVTATKQ